MERLDLTDDDNLAAVTIHMKVTKGQRDTIDGWRLLSGLSRADACLERLFGEGAADRDGRKDERAKRLRAWRLWLTAHFEGLMIPELRSLARGEASTVLARLVDAFVVDHGYEPDPVQRQEIARLATIVESSRRAVAVSYGALDMERAREIKAAGTEGALFSGLVTLAGGFDLGPLLESGQLEGETAARLLELNRTQAQDELRVRLQRLNVEPLPARGDEAIE